MLCFAGYSRKYCEYCSSTKRARVDCDRKKKEYIDFEVCDDTQVCGRVDAWVNAGGCTEFFIKKGCFDKSLCNKSYCRRLSVAAIYFCHVGCDLSGELYDEVIARIVSAFYLFQFFCLMYAYHNYRCHPLSSPLFCLSFASVFASFLLFYSKCYYYLEEASEAGLH